MMSDKANIIAQLRKEILPLQGYKPLIHDSALNLGIGPIKNAFPNGTFPLGAIHEFICDEAEDKAATTGFITGILSPLIQNTGTAIWIGASQTVFPPTLDSMGLIPERVIFINLQKEKEILWTMEEALKCDGLSVVIADIQELSFIASRRLQLAVEQSLVTGFVVRYKPKNLGTNACVTRWKIKPEKSVTIDGLPGVGFPRWNIELVKVRNGNPGSWIMEWSADGLMHIPHINKATEEKQRKAS